MSSTKFVFSGQLENKMARPGLLLADTFLTSPQKPLNRVQQILTGSKISTSSTKFVFFGPIGKTRWPPLPLIGWDIFRLLLWNGQTEFNETWKEARSQRPTKFVLFGPIGKTRWAPWPLIGWDIFDFSSETAERDSMILDRKQDLNVLPGLCFLGWSEKQDSLPGLWMAETFSTSPSETAKRNSTKLDRKQDLNVLYQVCVFQADGKNKTAALASDWLRNFLARLHFSAEELLLYPGVGVSVPVGVVVHMHAKC